MENKNALRFLIGAIIIILIAIGVMYLMPNKQIANEGYNRESTRTTVDLQNTDIIKELRDGNAPIDGFLGGHWDIMYVPIEGKYEGFLKEKFVFLKRGSDLNNWSELVVFDLYEPKAFQNVSSYMKTHAQELEKKNADGRIKVLHDGDKGIIYQWRLAGANEEETTYLEMGKVEQTKDGVFSIKYVNKGTADLEDQRKRAIEMFLHI